MGQVDLTPWLQFGAMGLLGAIVLVVGPKTMERTMAAHQKALEEVARATRETNQAIIVELRSISGQLMRLVLALATRYPDVAKEVQAVLEPHRPPNNK